MTSLNDILQGRSKEAAAAPDRRMWRSIRMGAVVTLVFVVGLGVWASFAPVTGAVAAPGIIKVENNRKTIKHLEPGLVGRIYVREGDAVKKGQLLLVFDDTQAKAQVAVLQTSRWALMAENARFQAEAANRPQISFPAELLASARDPEVAAMIASQRALFQARRDVLASQMQIGAQRAAQLDTQITGLQAQVTASDTQLSLNTDELNGVSSLFKEGYAPKTRLLALQRNSASLQGTRGDQVASIARAQQAIGETRVQTLTARQTRISEAAAGLQETEAKLADIGPRLIAARESLSHTEVRAPVDGVVLNLTQFTEGASVGPNEPLLDVVPVNTPLVIEARIRPQDVQAVKPGQDATVTLMGYNTRTTPRVQAKVVTVSADQTVDPHSEKAYFSAALRIPPEELRRLPAGVQIHPGMPLSLSIVNGERTVMGYLLGPMIQILRQSLHED